MAGCQAVLGLVAAVVTEFVPAEQDKTVMEWFQDAMNEGFTYRLGVTLLWMLGVCVAALTVNFTSFGLIGKVGPIAYAVVGHAKTVLTIILGIVLFRSQETHATIIGDIVGCSVALCGVLAYTHFEYCFHNKVPDWVEKNLPALVKSKTVVQATNGNGKV